MYNFKNNQVISVIKLNLRGGTCNFPFANFQIHDKWQKLRLTVAGKEG